MQKINQSLDHKIHPISLTDELWDAFYGDLEENWQRYNGTVLYYENSKCLSKMAQ